MGEVWDGIQQIGIFGLFKDDQGEHMVVPLKFSPQKT